MSPFARLQACSRLSPRFWGAPRHPWRQGFVAACLSFFALGAAQAGEKASYVVSLAGLNFASVETDLNIAQTGFTLTLDATVSGVGSLVASGTAAASASGDISPEGLVARDFNLHTRADDKDFTVEITYANGDAQAFKIDPPVVSTADRVAIERKDLLGVADPMASFILKADRLDPSLCNREMTIFTGIERFNLAMSFAAMQTATSARTGYQGPVILCRIDYEPVSGHFTSSTITDYLARSDRVLIWYAPLKQSGYVIPYRVLIGTSAGDLSMVLTQLR